MKITALTPPELTCTQPAERTAGCTRVVYDIPNIYLLTVCAVARQAGHDLTWCDFSHPAPSTIDALREFLRTDDSDVYFIWTVNLSLESDLPAIELIRAERPRATVILMGPGATYFTARCLKTDGVIVVRGEPEQTVAELLEKISQGHDWHDVIGISFLKDGELQNNPPRPPLQDIDSLPFPARDLLGDKQYHNPKLKLTPYTTVVTSRNCPFHCIYCVPSSLTFAREIEYRREHGRKPPIAYRSPANVQAEIAELAALGYKAIGFVDDNFIWNEERTAALCDIMRRYNMAWGCQARVDAITDPIARMLAESGCRYVDLGIESFDDRILEFVHKGITSAQIYEAIALLKKYKVPVKLNVLIGTSPLETRETVSHSLREAKRLKVDQVMFNIVSPFPGTEFYQMCMENGWLVTPDYVPTDVQRNSILRYPHLDADEMERILFRSNLSYFLRPSFIWKHMRQFRNFNEFRCALRALRIKLFGAK